MSAQIVILSEWRERKTRVEIPVADPLALWVAWANFWLGRYK